MPYSYNGWPASKDPLAIGIKPLKVAGRDFPAGVKGGDVLTVFTYVAAHMHWRVESLYAGTDKDDWGYAFRPNTNNPSELSCHGSGTAIDFNATSHPNGVPNTYTYAQVKTIKKILVEVGGVVVWLEDEDEMHFEIADVNRGGSPAEVKAVARRLKNPGWWTRELKVGMRGEDVRFVRKRLGLSDSTLYSQGVGDAVARLRRKLWLPPGTTVSKGMAFYIGAK